MRLNLIILVLIKMMYLCSLSAQTTLSSQGFNSTSDPAGWARGDYSGTAAITYVSSSSYPTGFTPSEGTYFVKFNSYDCSSGNQGRLKQTSSFSTVGYTNITVNFKWTKDDQYSASNDYVNVQYSTNGTSWTTAGSNVTRYQASGDSWTSQVIALPAGAENQSTLYVAFLFTSRYGNDCYLDDVVIQGTASVKSLGTIVYNQASTADVLPNSVNNQILRIDFPVTGSSGTMLLNSIEVKASNTSNSDIAVGGVKLYRTTTTTFSTTNQLGTSQSLSSGVATFSSLNYDLPAGTTYIWVAYDIVSNAPLGNIVDAFIETNKINVEGSTYPASNQSPAGTRTINLTHCAANGTTCDEYIGRVQVGSIDNSSACGLSSGYSNYMAQSTTMNVGTGYPITVTNGPPNYASDRCGIWVDWNRDGDFNDANETISVTGTPGTGPYTATITPPAGAASGATKLRIRVHYNDEASSACGSSVYGEVEDYTINVVAYNQSSDIISANNETSNINYASKTGAAINSTADAIRVWSFTIRDGGGVADADAVGTILNSVLIEKGASNGVISWANAIKQAALYDGSTEVAEVSVTGENINFSSISSTAPDNGNKTLDLYLTFETTNIIDNEQFHFKISNTSVTASGSGSGFSAFSEISSSVASDNNRIEVTADRLAFETDKPPSSVAINSNFLVTVKATDINGNRDYDNSCSVTLAKNTGTGVLSSVSGLTKSLSSGIYNWTDVRYNTAEVFKIETQQSCGLTNVISGNINCINPPQAFSITAPLSSQSCSGNVTVSWGASTNATSYDLYYCTGTGCNPSVLISGVTSPYTFNASIVDTIYNFKIKAINAAGELWSSNTGTHRTSSGYSWKGATSTTWSTGTNWCGGSAPNANTHDVHITQGSPNSGPTLTGSVSVRNLTIYSGVTLNVGTYTVSVYGNFVNNGTITGSGKILFTGTNDQNIDNGASGTLTTNIEINKTSGTVLLINNTLDIDGNFTLTDGTLNANSQDIEISGNWSSSDNFIPGSGTVIFDGTGTSTMLKNGPVVTLYASGFEDADGGISGWNLGTITSNTRWARQTAGSRTGSYNLATDIFQDNNTSNTTQSYCYTCSNNYLDAYRELDLSDYSSATLNFYWKMYGTNGANRDRGQALIDGNDLVGDLYFQNTYQSASGISLNAYCGSKRLLTFRFTMQGQYASSGVGFCVDDITITGNTSTETFNKIKVNKSGGGQLQLSSAFNANGNIEISSGILNANGKKIRFKGDFINNGTYTSGNNEVIAYGSTTQTIKGSQNTTFYKLSKETTSELIIGDNSTPDKVIEVTNLFSWTDNNDKLTVGDGVKTTFKIANSLNIRQGCTLETKNSSIVSIAKHFSDYGTYTYNDGMIKFHGSTNSYILREPAFEIYREDFESGSTGWTNGGTQTYSRFQRLQGMGHNSDYDIAVIDFSNSMPYDYDWSPGSSGSTEISKTISLSGYNAAQLKFWWRCGGDANDYGKVFINADDVTSQVSLSGDGKLRNQTIYTESPLIDLASYIASGSITLKFVFYYNTTSGYAPGLCIDDILISSNSNNLETFYDLTVDKTSASTILLCPIDVNNNVLVNSGDFKTSGINFPVGGNWDNLGASTLTHGSNTITFDGNGTSKPQNINIGNTAFYNVTLNNSGGTATITNNTLDIDKDLVFNAGTLDANTQDIEIDGNWTNNGGTFTARTKKVSFIGNSDQYIKSNSNNFYDVVMNKSGSLILSDNIGLYNDLVLTSGLFDVSASNRYVTIAGDWFNNGGSFDCRQGLVTFNGNATQIVNKKLNLTVNNNNFRYYNVTIDGIDVIFYYDSDNYRLNVNNLIINNGKSLKGDDE